MKRLLAFFRREPNRTIVDALLAQRGQVAMVWGIKDVQAIRPDLKDWQAWDVLEECRQNFDREIGVNSLLIEAVADALFPAPKQNTRD
jgi:hypothetical protein